MADYATPVVPVRFERAIRDRLRAIAKRRGLSVSAVIREQVLRHLQDLDRWDESDLVSPRGDGMEP